MKRTITLLIATALIFGMSQCKKNVETITPSNLGEAVHITVNVDDGGKHIVFPGTGVYVFENGDKLYVGNGGHYIGYLTYGSGAFSGDIYSPSTEDYLHFYFVGGLTPSDTPEAGTTTDFTVSIANQSSKLPVLSYAHSTQKYVDGTTTYGCTLLNKCGLVKFVPAIGTIANVIVGGMKTTASINFATGSEGITPTGATGNVTLYSESDAAKWAILLPQDAVSSPDVDIEGYTSTITSVPAVTENMYYTNGGNGVSIEMESLPYIDAEFTVASGTTVKFSKGNLQYQGSNDKFRFAEHQYDYVGNAAGNTAPSASQANWIDLFGWGTSGYNNKYPYMTSTTYSDYGNGTNNNISGTDYDWGVYNKQSNQNKIEGGGDHAWRVLTNAEWGYVFNTRSTTSGHRYTKAIVCGVKGVILLPDNWSDGTYSLNKYNTTGTEFRTNTIDPDGWATLEAAGCVFLPAAGYRNGTSVSNVDSFGYYWSSTYNGNSYAYCVRFYLDDVDPSNRNSRYYGHSVRLVFEESRIYPCQ